MSIHQMAEFSFSVAISLHLTFLIGRANVCPWAVTVSRGGSTHGVSCSCSFQAAFFFYGIHFCKKIYRLWLSFLLYHSMQEWSMCMKQYLYTECFWRYVVSIKPNKSWVELEEEISMAESYLAICSYFIYLMYVL